MAPTVTLKLNCSLYSAVAHSVVAAGVATNQIQAQLRTDSKVIVKIPISVEAQAEMSKRKLNLAVRQLGEGRVVSAE